MRPFFAQIEEMRHYEVRVGGGAHAAMSIARVEAFSDGVFATAITLLVLGLHAPGAGRSRPATWFSGGSRMLPFVVSFGTIGIIWLNQSTLFGHLRHIDRMLVFSNLLLLIVVAFIPFPTDVLAGHVRTGGADSRIAAAVYGASMSVLGVFTVIWWRVSKSEHLLTEGTTTHYARASLRRSLKGPVEYLAPTGVCLASAPAALIAYAAVAVSFALTGRSFAPASAPSGRTRPHAT